MAKKFPTDVIDALSKRSSSTSPSKRAKGPGVKFGEKLEKKSNDKWGRAEQETLAKSMLNLLDGPEGSIERLAFAENPHRIDDYVGIYKPKLQLIPDVLLKRVAIQDDLIAAIVRIRSNHISQFGRKQSNRHEKGFKLVPDESIVARMSKEDKDVLQKRIDAAEKKFISCGSTVGVSKADKCSFAEYLAQVTRNGIVVGRSATEVTYTPDPADPANEEKRKFHSFRPVDGGTIYYASNSHSAQESVRKEALALLSQLNNEKLKPEKFEADEYEWVQVIDGRPVQAFTAEEMLVQNFYPVTDIELRGYPLTPIDTAISAIATHINITTHNKLYFQNGRAARGMLVIKSNDVDDDTVAALKQQFNANINSTANSWRTPVFGIGPEDELSWETMDAGGRDMEFQYLSDSNARTIFAAFQMSPEEAPGYQHLVRGTNSQALSEGNNEYKLTAARDIGIRPLMATIEDGINDDIFPLIDPQLAKICKFKFVGLDADTEEKESVRISQDMPLHLTYDEILEKVEKKPIGKRLGGAIPLNPTALQVIEKYLTFGEIQEYFLGVEGAAKDSTKQFYQNNMWMAWTQQQQQMQMAQQQAQAQAQQAPQGGPGGAPGGGQGQPGADLGGSQDAQGGQEQGGELSTGIDQALQMLGQSGALGKSEANLPANKKRLKHQIAETNRRLMSAWRAEQEAMLKEIVPMIVQHAPPAKS